MIRLFLFTIMAGLGLNAFGQERAPSPSNWRNADFITTGLFEHCSGQIKELFNKGTRLTSVKVNTTGSHEWTVFRVDSMSGDKVSSSAMLEVYSWVDNFRTRFKCGEVKEVR